MTERQMILICLILALSGAAVALHALAALMLANDAMLTLAEEKQALSMLLAATTTEKTKQGEANASP